MEDLGVKIEFGGVSKTDLLQKLNEAGILLNEFAGIIFSNELFQTSKAKKTILITDVFIKDLGFPQGATSPQIREHIKNVGLSECPIELAPYLRLKLRDQPEISADLSLKNQSPLDAITIFSDPLIEDDNFPKGFYLRKMEGKLWLRGYTSYDEYVWKPNDKMVFMIVNAKKARAANIGFPTMQVDE